MFSQRGQEAHTMGGNMICNVISVKTSQNSMKASILQQLSNTQVYSFSLVPELPTHLTVIWLSFQFYQIREVTAEISENTK